MSLEETIGDVQQTMVAVIGMAGSFPGAPDIDTFWDNLSQGVESVTFFSDDDLRALGLDPAAARSAGRIPAGAILAQAEYFDAEFFGYTPREAAIMDPQQRVFLECAWTALEHSGYDPSTFPGAIGLYAGAGRNTYLLQNLSHHPEFSANMGDFSVVDYQLMLGNGREFLATRVAYKLNLHGPALTIQTACSTSLVAVHSACQALLSYECDIALAGGVSVRVPQRIGYLHQEGWGYSADGHCRAFDAQASGTVYGNGAGAVTLKRLDEALADGDTIYALIRGTAINNDGSSKVSFMAPSIDGQAAVIRQAQSVAQVSADSVGYIEAHGTGTALGDPVEVAALTQAFRATTSRSGFCAIGSVKTNVGHLDAAAGVTGLIKTVLALRHRQLPPSLHYTAPNPRIDFASSPFYVISQLREWPEGPAPRRAGVSSFGLGGTNAHIVLEEAPPQDPAASRRSHHLLLLSAKTPTALETMTGNLAAHLRRHPEQPLADVAYTSQVGRQAFAYRRILVCKDHDDAAATLSSGGERVLSAQPEYRNPPVVFMFPGGGTQYVGMGRELYEQEPVFREHLDACAAAVSRQAKLDLHALLYPTADQQPYAAAQLERPSHFLPAVFSVSYALAQLWMSWGVRPEAMIGHSLGEYVAACLAGVMSLEDALKLVCVRGLLSEQLPAAAMLIVPLAEREIVPLLGEALVIAAINGPEQCVVAGPIAAINALEQQLTAREVICRRLRVAGASHTPLVEPIIEPFLTALSSLRLSAPQTPYVSNVTGTWITAEQATSPAYWADHLRHTVRFSDGAGLLLEDQRRVLLEIGPGRTLSTLAKLVPTGGRQQVILTSLRHPQEPQSDVAFLLATVGRLWLAGVSLDWAELHRDEPRRRVALPTYPFERQRFFIERQAGLPLARDRQAATPAAAPQPSNQKNPDPARWFYAPSWRREPPPAGRALAPEAPEHWLVFSDGWGLAERLVQRLRAAGQGVVTAAAGASFARLSPTDYQLDPARGEDYRQLLGALIEAGQMPQVIVHCWGVTAPELQRALDSSALDRGFFSLLLLAQALDQHDCADPLDLVVVTSDQHDVLGHEPICPEKATVLGPCTVIPQEYPQIACRSVDLSLPAPEAITDTLIEQLIGDCLARSSSAVIAYRGSYRWVRSFGPVSPAAAARPGRLRQRGVYLITGGLGGVGLAVSEYLAEHAQARLVLVGRSSFPEASGWDEWLSSHPAQDATSQKIRQLRSLEARGAEILIARADVSDLQQVRDVVAQAQERFGAVHGIIHAAALPGSGMIALKPQAVAASVLGPKVQGTRVLEAVSRELPLDFIVLCSSLTAVAGGIGQIDYCAANAFLDAFASYLRRTTDIFVTSIDWGDVWQVGGVVNTLDSLVPRELRDMRESAIQKGISPEEGAAAFARVLLHCDAPQIVVSSRDIEAAIVDTFSYARLQGEIDKYLGESAANARPQIETTYVAPTNDVEQHLAEIWQALLGIERIGIHDNFFELGGHSLLATLLVSRLNATFEIKLPLRRIFEAPTIAALAIVVEERLIEELETLSDEEAIKAL